MIQIVFQYQNDAIISLVIKGHSQSAPKGEDLICSAVSAVAQGGVNSLDNIESFNLEVKDGYLKLEAKDHVSKHDQIVLEVIHTQLLSIEEVANKYVKVVEKGK